MDADAFACDVEFSVDEGLANYGKFEVFGGFGCEVNVDRDGFVWQEGSKTIVWLDVYKLDERKKNPILINTGIF